MNGQLLAAACDHGDPGYCPPNTDAFLFKPFFTVTIGSMTVNVTKVTLLMFLGVALVIWFFMAAIRHQRIVPSKLQWLGESAYGFVRNGIARDIIGPEGAKFAPYLLALFFFVLSCNLWGVVPFAQIPVTSELGIPAFLALLTWLIYNGVGIKRHGALGYLKMNTVPSGAPIGILPLLAPMEFLSNFIVRPFTLAIRLFANMFAGHMLLLVFATGTIYLLEVGNFSTIFFVPTGLMSIIMTLFELFIECLQAYVFTILTAVYISGALADEH